MDPSFLRNQKISNIKFLYTQRMLFIQIQVTIGHLLTVVFSETPCIVCTVKGTMVHIVIKLCT